VPTEQQVARHARISDDGKYRYHLGRYWGSGMSGRQVAFVGLNPSTADAAQDDPTVRRCIRFARDWGFDQLLMVNLFAFRSTDPSYLWTASDPVGPENDQMLRAAAVESELVVGAWGAHELAIPAARRLDRLFRELRESGLVQRGYSVLGLTRSGAPRHPLYMKASCVPLDPGSLTPVPLPRQEQRNG
jgi:hypothetical protein